MGVEDLKRALKEKENAETWRNKIIKEKPLLELAAESRKSLSYRRAKFEQLSNRFSKPNGVENYPPPQPRFRAIVNAEIVKRRFPVGQTLIGENRQKCLSEVVKPTKIDSKKSTDLAGEIKNGKVSKEKVEQETNVEKNEDDLQYFRPIPASHSNKLGFAVDDTRSMDVVEEDTDDKQNETRSCNLRLFGAQSSTKPIASKVSSRPLVGKRLPTRLYEKQQKDMSDRDTSTSNSVSSTSADNSAAMECSSSKSRKEFELGKEFTTESNNPPTDAVEKPNDVRPKHMSKVAFKLPVDAFQIPVIGREHCGVKLRQLDTNSPFPDVMLVRFHGNRPLNVRLVCPRLSAEKRRHDSGFGSYLLITRDRLIIWNSSDSTVFNKSKASQMAYDILAGKELACLASKVEIANDDSSIMNAFVRITSPQSDDSSKCVAKTDKSAEHDDQCSPTDTFSNKQLAGDAEGKSFIFDSVFWVKGKDDIEMLSRGNVPSSKYFDPTKILIFDFITELYVWIGQNSDRSLISPAMKFAEKLKNTPFNADQEALFGLPQNEKDAEVMTSSSTGRPNWTIMRKQTQGIADCLFRFKFEDWIEKMTAMAGNSSLRGGFLTPATSNKKFGGPSGSGKRPWSVPAAFGGLTSGAMSNRISSLCSDNAFFGILKDEDKLVDDVAADLGTRATPSRQALQLEGLELRVSDENLFTEKLVFHQLANEENLKTLDEPLLEFTDSECYVIEWHYRIEREGIRRLNGDRISVHETGRQRVAYFYWLGSKASVKDKSRCALALRKYDKNRQEHIRIECGHEPPVFLHLLNGQMIVSGTGSNCFVVIGSKDNLFSAEEMPEPVEFRSQSAYLCISDDGDAKLECWKGDDCSQNVVEGAQKLGKHLALSRGLTFDTHENLLLSNSSMPFGSKYKSNEFIPFLIPIKWSGTAPRLYRIYGNEGEELSCERFDTGINFTFRQTDLRDCVLVDQSEHLWIWSEDIARTFELKVADKIWHDIKGNPREPSESATVICKNNEPDEFKALFPTWRNYDQGGNGLGVITEKSQKISNTFAEQPKNDPQSLVALLHERTRTRSIDELRRRQLPKGCDTKHLERYLSDVDFLTAFKCSRAEYEKLPRWKQISLKKEADLF